jgi:hypothetical protein
MSFRASLAVLAGFFLLLPCAFLALLVLGIALPPVLVPAAYVVGMLIAFVALLALLALYPASIIWAYRDANSRGKPGWVLALIVAFAYWPFGLLVWLLFRPEKTLGYRNIGAGLFAGNQGHV